MSSFTNQGEARNGSDADGPREITSATAIDGLIDHVTSNGGEISYSLSFQLQKDDSSEGYGVMVKEDVPKGYSLISIPLSLCMSCETISKFPKLKPIFDENPGLLDYPDEVLAIGLMYAMLNDIDSCPWAKHVTTMPTTFNTTLYWEEEELAELRYHVMFHLTKMMKNQISADYDSIHKPLAANFPELLNGMSRELYTWALSVVYSRSIEVTLKDGKHVRVIAPLLDMANHKAEDDTVPADTFHFDEEKEIISLKTSEDLKSGQECYATYGIYPNAKLLYTYGFVLLNNPHKAIDLWAKVPPETVAAEQKQTLLQQHPLTCNQQTFDFTGTLRSNYIAPALLATIKVIQADAAEMADPAALARAFQSGQMVSVRNELAAYGSLRSLIVARMRAEDAQSEKEQLGQLLLADTPRDNRRLLALIVKVDERALLEESLALLDTWSAELQRLGENYVPPY